MPIAKNLLGLDLGSHSLKAVELSQGLRALEVVQMHAEPRSNQMPLAEQIERMLVTRSFSREHVVSAVRGDRLSVRLLDFPFAEKRRLSQAVPFEIEDRVPFDMDHMLLDWDVVHRRAGQIVRDLGPGAARGGLGPDRPAPRGPVRSARGGGRGARPGEPGRGLPASRAVPAGGRGPRQDHALRPRRGSAPGRALDWSGRPRLHRADRPGARHLAARGRAAEARFGPSTTSWAPKSCCAVWPTRCCASSPRRSRGCRTGSSGSCWWAAAPSWRAWTGRWASTRASRPHRCRCRARRRFRIWRRRLPDPVRPGARAGPARQRPLAQRHQPAPGRLRAARRLLVAVARLRHHGHARRRRGRPGAAELRGGRRARGPAGRPDRAGSPGPLRRGFPEPARTPTTPCPPCARRCATPTSAPSSSGSTAATCRPWTCSPRSRGASPPTWTWASRS